MSDVIHMMKPCHISAVANTKKTTKTLWKGEVVQSSQVSFFWTFNLDLEVGITCAHLDEVNADHDWSQVPSYNYPG